MKKILIINSGIGLGGVERSLISFLWELDETKYDISLLLIDKEGELYDSIPSYVKVLECPFKNYIQKLESQDIKSIIIGLAKEKKLLRAICLGIDFILMKLFNCDEIMAAALFEMTNRPEYDIILNYSGMSNYPHLLACYFFKGLSKYTWVHSEPNEHNDFFRRMLYRYKKYDAVFAVSNSCAEQLKSINPEVADKVFVQYNVVSKKMCEYLALTGEGFKDEFDGIRILSVGRLSYEKGFDIALEVANILKENGNNFRWYIVGDGREKTKLSYMVEEKELSDYVYLLGSKTNPYRLYKECDIYVQPSRFEAYGITITEAKIFNRPVITTSFPGAYEQIQNNENGLIVNAVPNDIANELKKLLEDKSLRNKLGSKEGNNNSTISVFEEIINGREEARQ